MRGMIGLFGLAAAFSWVMGLMGYIRSSGRLMWHVNELMADVSPWAFTPNLEFAAKMVTLNMMVFWGAVLTLFWMCQRGQQPVLGDFQAKEGDGFPANWDHESQRSQTKGREAYKVQTEGGANFLSAKDAGQRIKKKKIDWDPKAYPVLSWR